MKGISLPFIQRPIATTLLTFAIALAGAMAYFLLPVAPLPQVDFPTISVSANLPGASPQTMATTVATPLERSLGRIAGITEMTSSSALGSTRITLQFDLSRDIDGAARDVQAAINAASSLLPTGLPSLPTYRKVNPADAPIMILALTSNTLTQAQLYDAASTVLAQKIAQLQGIGQVNVGGSALPAVRVELNPMALQHYGLSYEAIRNAIAANNVDRPKGTLEDGHRHWQIYANDQSKTAQDYLPIIVRYQNGFAVRLRDIAQVRDSVEDVRNAGIANGKPAVLLMLYRQPGANIIATVDRVKAALPLMSASVPSAANVDIVLDRTPTIRASLLEVERTLLISVFLVILVVFIFLRSAHATLIPSIAVPVSLIGTFAVMYLCGFSLNILSLMALTIATGFVVDDAIVVLENISRHIEKGLTPYQAAIKGAREVGFTVLSISISLIAVFIPILMMGGIVGRLFREFAVTLSVAILMSLLVSLTTTPMLCARWLNSTTQRPGKLFRLSERGFSTMLAAYERALTWVLRHRRLTLTVLLATIALNIYLYVVIQKGFFPQQDTGRLVGSIQADQRISFQSMQGKLQNFIDIVRQDPAVSGVVGFTGGGQRNTGTLFVVLIPVRERGETAAQVIARLRSKTTHVPGATLFLQAVQDIRMGGRPGNGQYQFTLQADDLTLLHTWEPRVREALMELPQLVDVSTDAQDAGLQTTLTIDRDYATSLGINMQMIDNTLNDAFGQRQVSTIYDTLNQYHVVMEVAPSYWQNPQTLHWLQTTSAHGVQIPFATFSQFGSSNTPLGVNHQGQFAASTLSFNLPAHVSLGDASQAITQAIHRIGMPNTLYGHFSGTAKAFQESLANQPWLIFAALLTVYIVLGILYESLVHPLTILSTLPSAGIGALLALMACNIEFSIIALIGVILLIGIVKKNAIMMIDFAIDAERHEQCSPHQAIYQACVLRFRPIMMTTLAAMLGALPLALGAGDGAEFRRPLGIAIVGGLLFSQVLTLFTTPVVYLYMDDFRLWCKRRWAR
ncbi:MAG: multidrug efflux RND transporter permease subunit [Ottowia sp.]|nr:multidrug efflux RND transporter permease subunit [Ottowia sp.]